MATTTPFVKRMRTQGGTIYTFSSALEDIGLNINERNNIVKMSHYALLNLPSIDVPVTLPENHFNVLAIPGAYESFVNGSPAKDARVAVAESFQNYALNLEVNLLAQTTYNPSLQTTVSERVFWKWLKETGAIRWQPVNTSVGTYWQEETDLVEASIGYHSVVKGIGYISAGSVRTDTFGTYNETYVLVPTSYGQTSVFFKQVEDDNYKHGMSIVGGHRNILGRENYLQPHPDALDIQAYYDLADSSTKIVGPSLIGLEYDNSIAGWWWTQENRNIAEDNCYFTDSSSYITDQIYNTELKYKQGAGDIKFLRSKVDCLSIEFDLNQLKNMNVWGNPPTIDPALTFDKMSIEYAEDDKYDFNAILLYYSVYNKAADVLLATNLLGILILNPPNGNLNSYPTGDIVIPSITKLQSGPNGFGTSYSFRLNIKSDYMLDDTAAVIQDESTSAQTALSNWADVFDNLGRTLAILNQQTGTLTYITEQYLDITANQTNIENQIAQLSDTINTLGGAITGDENTISMFSSGAESLVESSIYMKNGQIGLFTTAPAHPVDINANTKVKELIIENAIKDVSGNILLGYGSPLQLGSSTNYREINMYTGNASYGFRIDTSNNVYLGSMLNASTGYTLYYDPTTKKITYSTAPASGGSGLVFYSGGAAGNGGLVLGYSGNNVTYTNSVQVLDEKIKSQFPIEFQTDSCIFGRSGWGFELGIIAGESTTMGYSGGNLFLRGGAIKNITEGAGGNVYLDAGAKWSNVTGIHGSVYIATSGSTNEIKIGAPGTSVPIYVSGLTDAGSSSGYKSVLMNTANGRIYYGDVSGGSGIGGGISGGGTRTAGYIPVFSDPSTITDSGLSENYLGNGLFLASGYKISMRGTIGQGLKIEGAPSTSGYNGGDVSIYGGTSSTATGGSIYLEGGPGIFNGSIVLGSSITNGIYSKALHLKSSSNANTRGLSYDTNTGEITYVAMSFGLDAYQTKDPSILTKLSNYTVVQADAGKIIQVDGNYTIYFPGGLSQGFQVRIVNLGTGTITIDASTASSHIYSTVGSDIPAHLATQYTDAVIYNRGSGATGTWICTGSNLT